MIPVTLPSMRDPSIVEMIVYPDPDVPGINVYGASHGVSYSVMEYHVMS